MKSLKDMMAEVDAYCADKGWRANGGITFGERAALLHSEVSEALEAWRSWGLEDATVLNLPEGKQGKPEGVGSEFADILIRLLDDCVVAGMDLEAELLLVGQPRFAVSDRFGENINALHQLIARATGFHALGDSVWRQHFADVYTLLCQLCDLYGIDLEAEYERKMAYNRSRPYRHGGKPI